MNRLVPSAGRLSKHAVAVIIAVVSVLPLWWMVVSSLRPLDEIFAYSYPFEFRGLVPNHLEFGAYRALLSAGFGRNLANTFFVGGLTVLGSLVVNGMAGYAFARMDFFGRRVLFPLVVLTFVVPFEAIAIPLYQVVNNLGLVDTYWALIIPAIPNGLIIFLFRQFFVAVPRELEEAARIDGAGWASVMWFVYRPMSRPVIITAAIVVFVTQWEAFLWPLLVIRTPELQMVQTALGQFQTAHSTQWDQLFAATTLTAIVPVLVILPLQRYYTPTLSDAGLR